jgi:hypothetical protein
MKPPFNLTLFPRKGEGILSYLRLVSLSADLWRLLSPPAEKK